VGLAVEGGEDPAAVPQWYHRPGLLALGVAQPELGTSLFEIAPSLFALERTLILRAMALLEAKSEAL
jgi:hypothetical protein